MRAMQLLRASLPIALSTGLVFAAIAFIVAYLSRSHGLVRSLHWRAAMLTIVSLAHPNVLHPLNVTWTRFWSSPAAK